jgi:DNA invertase Pin-like site-specific DNA recombinase
MFHMCGVFARVRARHDPRTGQCRALRMARAKGKRLGRRPIKPAEERIRELRAEGMGILKIGRTVGVGTSVVQRIISAAVA